MVTLIVSYLRMDDLRTENKLTKSEKMSFTVMEKTVQR
jgi:hypothetical protein